MTRLHPKKALRAGVLASFFMGFLVSDSTAPTGELIQAIISTGAIVAALVMALQLIIHMTNR